MIKRIFILLIVALALFYAGAGIYFYNKSKGKKIVNVIPKTNEEVIVPEELIILKEVFFDFENGQPANIHSFSSERAASGIKSIRINPESEYGSEIKKAFSEIPSLKNFRRIEITLKVWNENEIPDNLWVLEVDGEDGKVLSWNAEGLPVTSKKWETCLFTFDIKTEFLKNFNHIKTYAWNRNKGTFYIDDVQIRFLGIQSDDSNLLFSPLKQSTFYYDLENDSSLEKTESLSEDLSHSGKRSSLISGKNEYSVTISKKVSDVMNDTISTVNVSVWLYPLSDKPECTLSLEIRNSDDESIFWNGKSTSKMNLKANSWQKLNASLNMSPEDYRKIGFDDRLYIYVVNNGRSKIYVDDFMISFGDIPDRRGDQTFVDMNTSGGNYEFNRYHPPYKISKLLLSDIHNDQSAFLVQRESIKLGEVFPDQVILTGNFSGRSSVSDELLVISESEISLYGYCNRNSGFTLSGSIPFNGKNIHEPDVIAGDFNADGKQEVIILSGKLLSMYNFSVSGAGSCVNNFHGMKMNPIVSKHLTERNNKMFSGKFTGKNYDELFSVDRNGKCIIERFTGNAWSIILSDTISSYIFSEKSTQVVGRFFSSSNDEILSVYNYKNLTKFALTEFSNGKITTREVPDQDKAPGVLEWNSKLQRIPSGNGKYDGILSFNHQWRFELKIISTDARGFYVSSIPEFTGYVSDRNPKYYEIPKIIAGRFSGNDFGLLCILYNCADRNFDGTHCREYDSIPDLPNSVQLYNFLK